MSRLTAVGVLALAGCLGTIEDSAAPLADAGASPPPPLADAAAPDAAAPDAGGVEGLLDGIAPDGAVPGERLLGDGDTPVALGPATTVYRIDARAREHIAFVLSFTGGSNVAMGIDRWNGHAVVELGANWSGPTGLRHMAVLDPSGARTYWVRLSSATSAPGKLTVTRSAWKDGPRCDTDCARLIQMPLPNDPALDGYTTDDGTIFRYWFGRRDIVMMVRYAARERARAGKRPFIPHDFSQWDGMTPGVDVGSPRHVSHQRGKDVDLTIYGLDGLAPWRSYCTIRLTSDGQHECTPGTRKNFDGYETAREVASCFASGRVTMSFLDRELIPAVRTGATAAADAGLIPRDLLPLYSDGKHIQHWPNHDDHIHVRVSEVAYGTRIGDEPFEAP